MSESARYVVPGARHRAEQTIDRSRFICTVQRAPSPLDAENFLREMNDEFSDATHNCWAYLIGAPGSTDRNGMSDAGEPRGTAGRPMLTVLQHSGVGDIAAVVTRYYGGTNLGTGGLVKAYGGTVQLALATMPRVERIDTPRSPSSCAMTASRWCNSCWGASSRRRRTRSTAKRRPSGCACRCRV